MLVVCASMMGISQAAYTVAQPSSTTAYSHKHDKDSGSNPFQNLFTSDDLWAVLGSEMTLPHEAYRPEVKQQIDWFVKHPKYIYELAQNAKPYMYYVLQQVEQRNLPAEIALMPMIESAYDPFGVSPAGAVGLWQMMPGTASGFGLKINWWYDGRRDVVASTNAALNYLAYLQNFFNGNWILAIAAYDTGEGSVLSSVRKNTTLGKSTDFWDLPLPRETKNYVPKLLAIAEIISHPDKYPMKLPPLKNEPYMAEVDVGTQIDLQKAAELSDISLEELVRLNPGYNRWATSPNGPYKLIIPMEKVDLFKANLAKLPKDERVTWQRYNVKSGDTLGGIARKYNTTVTLLKSVNKIEPDSLSIGEVIFIPMSTKRLSSEVIKSAQQYASADQEQLPGPQKTVHVVKKGESIWSIAQRYNVKEASIRFWNNLKRGAVLQPGDVIVMWKTPKHHAQPASDVKQILYNVQQGDNLAVIARHFSTDIATIETVNELNSDVLQLGQTLIIFEHLRLIHLPKGYMNYVTVESGDTLDKIAYAFNTNAHVIKQLNGLDGSLLHIGQKLVVVKNALPSIRALKGAKGSQEMVYIVKNGDSLDSIAKAFKVTIELIKKWNPHLGRSMISTGQVLIIYQ